MKPETFFDNFEVLAESPNGVQKLRELILQLAVRGKLVAQDEKDEPARILLDKIGDEKNRLVKEKKIRNLKPQQPIELDQTPFVIPANWEWVRLGEIGDWGSGSTPDRKNSEYYNGTIKWFKSGELNDNYINDSEEKITELALKKCSLRENKPGDVLIAMYGATIGKVAILETDATTNQAVCACTCFKGVYNRFLLNLLKAYKYRFIDQGAGGAQPNISREKIIYTVAPLPPLTEQHRIVTKVDQLMSLCDKLEVRQQKKRESRAHINSAALDRLLTARAPGEFVDGWRRIRDNFDLLYDAPENVGGLRQAILQLAVMGKLVAQDDKDEPASVLMEKIKAEKERLIKENKIKKNELLQLVKKGEIDYELPIGWTWCYLSEISTKISDGEHITPKRTSNGYYLLSARNVTNEGIALNDIDYVPKDEFDRIRKRCNPDKGDILISCSGSVGRIAIVDKDETYVMVRSAAFVKPYLNFINNKFLAYELKSPLVQKQILEKSKTSAQSNLFIGKIKEIRIAIPPFNEQKRIVTRVDQLLSLCDNLEAGLMRSQADSERLMEAVVGRMMAE